MTPQQPPSHPQAPRTGSPQPPVVAPHRPSKRSQSSSRRLPWGTAVIAVGMILVLSACGSATDTAPVSGSTSAAVVPSATDEGNTSSNAPSSTASETPSVAESPSATPELTPTPEPTATPAATPSTVADVSGKATRSSRSQPSTLRWSHRSRTRAAGTSRSRRTSEPNTTTCSSTRLADMQAAYGSTPG